MPFYRRFFIATARYGDEERVVGAGGVKAADWASNTHILYLSAVHPEYRNRGIGKRLVKARVEWIRSKFKQGRVVVSTDKLDRFKQLGFRVATKTCDQGRALMILDYS
jgi:GNAT superfamily N-acetyltransferase